LNFELFVYKDILIEKGKIYWFFGELGTLLHFFGWSTKEIRVKYIDYFLMLLNLCGGFDFHNIHLFKHRNTHAKKEMYEISSLLYDPRI